MRRPEPLDAGKRQAALVLCAAASGREICVFRCARSRWTAEATHEQVESALAQAMVQLRLTSSVHIFADVLAYSPGGGLMSGGTLLLALCDCGRVDMLSVSHDNIPSESKRKWSTRTYLAQLSAYSG